MPRFSFIVPCYNVEKTVSKCLDSLLDQTFKDFEVIVVNDGAIDNTQKVIDKYKKDKKIISYIKPNGGLSDARNYGVDKAKGDYILFVDSDDYVDITLLEKLNDMIERDKEIDIIKFSFAYVTNDVIQNIEDNSRFVKADGELAFKYLVNEKKPFEMPWIYAYNRKFWNKNKFMFPVGKYHEDFGLIPIVILKSKSISSIDEPLYFYVQSQNSITRSNDVNRIIKRTNDMLFHYDYLKREFNSMNIKDQNLKRILNSYISNALIYKAKELKGKNLDNYIKELKKRNIFDNLLDDNISRKTKKFLLKIYPKIFIKVL